MELAAVQIAISDFCGVNAKKACGLWTLISSKMILMRLFASLLAKSSKAF